MLVIFYVLEEGCSCIKWRPWNEHIDNPTFIKWRFVFKF